MCANKRTHAHKTEHDTKEARTQKKWEKIIKITRTHKILLKGHTLFVHRCSRCSWWMLNAECYLLIVEYRWMAMDNVFFALCSIYFYFFNLCATIWRCDLNLTKHFGVSSQWQRCKATDESASISAQSLQAPFYAWNPNFFSVNSKT